MLKYSTSNFIFSALPLAFLAIIGSFSFDEIFPWGAVLACLYWRLLTFDYQISFSSFYNRKKDLYLSLALIFLPLFQFSIDIDIKWWAFSIWPIVYLFSIANFEETKILREKKIHFGFMSIHIVLTASMVFFATKNWPLVFSYFLIDLFTFAPCFIHLGNIYTKRSKKITNKKLKLITTEELDTKKEQRLFYHDLINKTHGMHLFLSERLRKQDVKLEDIVLIQKEIYSLQTLIKDHAEISHRNLLPLREFVSYYEMRSKIQHLLKTYFSHSEVIFVENYSRQEQDSLNQFSVHQVSFERILGNLFKNAHEAKCSKIQLTINISSEELIFEMRNDFKKVKENSFQIAERLGREIMDHRDDLPPLGIESIYFLVERMHGQFSFGIEEGIWVSRIVLPNHISELGGRAKKVSGF